MHKVGFEPIPAAKCKILLAQEVPTALLLSELIIYAIQVLFKFIEHLTFLHNRWLVGNNVDDFLQVQIVQKIFESKIKACP